MNNLWLKALSLFLAVTVWFVVSAPRREAVSERAYAVQVSLARMPRDLVITKQAADTVSVRLRGRTSDLRSLSSQNLEVTLDLHWLQAGEAQVTSSSIACRNAAQRLVYGLPGPPLLPGPKRPLRSRPSLASWGVPGAPGKAGLPSGMAASA